MRGLVIKVPHIDRILDGRKIWEIRSSSTNIRGDIALIQSGSGTVVGKARLVDCIPLTKEMLAENFDKHLAEAISYKAPHAWVLECAERITPRPYEHPQGAIIWVKLPEGILEDKVGDQK